MDKYSLRYTPPFLSVSLVREDEHTPIFPTIHVELIPQPEPFQLITYTSGGNLTATYDPAPVIGEIICFFAWLHSPPVTVISEYMEEYGYNESDAKGALESLYCNRVRMCVETACNYVRKQIQSNLEYALTSLLNDAINRTFAAENDQAFIVKPIEALIRQGIREHGKRQRQVVNLRTRGGKRNVLHDWTDEECVNLAISYERLHPLWKAAKKIGHDSEKRLMSNKDSDKLFFYVCAKKKSLARGVHHCTSKRMAYLPQENKGTAAMTVIVSSSRAIAIKAASPLFAL